MIVVSTSKSVASKKCLSLKRSLALPTVALASANKKFVQQAVRGGAKFRQVVPANRSASWVLVSVHQEEANPLFAERTLALALADNKFVRQAAQSDAEFWQTVWRA